MANETENLALEHLRAIRTDISEIKLKVDELAGSYAGPLKIAAPQGDAIVRLEQPASNRTRAALVFKNRSTFRL